MAGGQQVGGPGDRFRALDNLIARDASALVIQNSQKTPGKLAVDEDGAMAFRSGLHRTFGVGKSDADKAANQASLGVLLEYIEQKGGRNVRAHVEQGLTDLEGSKGISVLDRMTNRGTYVSSALVAQIKALAVEGMKAEIERVTRFNANAATDFLARQQGVSLQGQQVQLQPHADSCGLTRLVDDLIAGDQTWPGDKYPRAWKELREHIQRQTGPDAKPEDGITKGLRAAIDRVVSAATAQGREVTEQELRDAAKAYLTGPSVFNTLVLATNDYLAARIQRDADGLVDAVRHWADEATPEELGNLTREDCYWLADQLDKNDLIEMPETGPFRAIKAFFQIQTFSEDRLSGALLDRLAAAIKEKHTPSDRIGRDATTVSEMREAMASVSKPKEYTRADFSRMLTSVIKPILQERHDRMAELDKEAASLRQGAQQTRGDRIKVFPELSQLAGRTRDIDHYELQHGKVDSAAGFLKAILLPAMLRQVQVDAEREALNGRTELGQQEIVDLARQVQQDKIEPARKTWERGFGEVVSALDDFADLQRDLEAIDARGGLKTLSAGELRELDDRMRTLAGKVPKLRQLTRDLESRFGKLDTAPFGEAVKALAAAADRIESGLAPFGGLSGKMIAFRESRMRQQLPALQAQHLRTPGPATTPTAMVKFPVMQHAPDLGQKALAVYSAWQKEVGVLDDYAELAIAHEDVAPLLRKRESAPQALTGEERQRLETFDKERQALGKRVESFARQTGALKRELGDAARKEPLLATFAGVDQSLATMRQRLETGRFPRTDQGNPAPRRGDGPIVGDPRLAERDLKRLDDAVLGGKVKMSEHVAPMWQALRSFHKFDQELGAGLRDKPTLLEFGADRTMIGRLDQQRTQVESGIRDLEAAIGSLGALMSELEDPNAFVSASGTGGGNPREPWLAAARTMRDDLQAQIGHMRERLADYALYRGDGFKDAAHFVAIEDATVAMRSRAAPPGGHVATLAPPLADIAGRYKDQPGVAPFVAGIPQGLKVLDDLEAFKTRAGQILSSPYSPSPREYRESAETLDALEAGLAKLRTLRGDSDTVKLAMTGQDWPRDGEALQRIDGGHAWLQLQAHLDQEIVSVEGQIKSLSEAIGRAGQRPPGPEAIDEIGMSRDDRWKRRLEVQEIGKSPTLRMPQGIALQTPDPVKAGQRFYVEPQRHSASAIHAMNAFLGGPGVSIEQLTAFNRLWSTRDEGRIDDIAGLPPLQTGGGNEADVPWAYLTYLHYASGGDSDLMPPVNLTIIDGASRRPEARAIPEIPGDRCIVGTQDPAHFVAFRKDDQGNWHLLDGADPKLQQPIADPKDYIREMLQKPGAGAISLTTLQVSW
ncbi:MAG: hypothetical protein U1E53_12900 [Dongiaceae bacterium]